MLFIDCVSLTYYIMNVLSYTLWLCQMNTSVRHSMAHFHNAAHLKYINISNIICSMHFFFLGQNFKKFRKTTLINHKSIKIKRTFTIYYIMDLNCC